MRHSLDEHAPMQNVLSGTQFLLLPIDEDAEIFLSLDIRHQFNTVPVI